MRRAHYPLQAMLYLVALHRYLRWRLPGLRPGCKPRWRLFTCSSEGWLARAFPTVEGGAVGAFAWSPPTGLVTGLSDLLAGQLESDEEAGSDGRRRV